MTYHWVRNLSIKMGAISEAGTVYTSGVHTHFSEVRARVARYFVFCVVLCRSLFYCLFLS